MRPRKSAAHKRHMVLNIRRSFEIMTFIKVLVYKKLLLFQSVQWMRFIDDDLSHMGFALCGRSR